MQSTLFAYLALLTAVSLEVAGTSALKSSQQFTQLWPSLFTVLCYMGAFYALSWVLRSMPVGIAYGIWSGLGIVLISLIGWVIYGEKLDTAALIGLGLILAGVVVVNVFSKSISH